MANQNLGDKPVITDALKSALSAFPNVKKVHFDENGDHHFTVHGETDEDGQPTGKIVTGGPADVRKVIVTSMSRKEVLDAPSAEQLAQEAADKAEAEAKKKAEADKK
jgi:hypothetical protein